MNSDQRVIGIHAATATLVHMPKRVEKAFASKEAPQLEPIFALLQKWKIAVKFVDKKTLNDLNDGEASHQGIVLSCKPFPYADLNDALAKKPNLVVVLDGVEDPRNLGRAARSAWSFGAQLLVIHQDRSAQVTSAAEKAAVGALAKLPVACVVNLRRALDEMRDAGIWLIGADAAGKNAVWSHDFSEPTALVIGAEDKGLRRLTKEGCDALLQIPNSHPEMSLNAADAATLFLYEVTRQRALRKLPK